MDNNLCEIIFLLDRSGSMSGLESDTIGGFNSFIKNQQKLGKTLVSTILFDDRYEILHNGADAAQARLSEREYFTRGSTALLDAIGKTILDVGLRLSNTAECRRPGKVLFVITTDGLENASREFSYDKINEMITHQRERYNWEFVFLGANIDVESESQKIGIAPERAVGYRATPAGTAKMYKEIDEMVCEMRAE